MSLSSRYYLSTLVIVAGLCSLGVEMTALTLLAPYFGTTQIVWASVIGVTLLYLTIGYMIGGRVADRWPRLGLLCCLLAAAGLAVSLVPTLSRPILHASMSASSYAMMAAGLVATLSLLAVPTILLGMASPFAVKLAVRDVADAGRTAGTLFALSTLGSLLGTFVPVLLLTPLLGTARTFQTFGLLLSLVSLPGLWRSKNRLWIVCALGLVIEFWLLTHPPTTIKSLNEGGMACEVQSFYNYIQVVSRPNPQGGDTVQLSLNESWGTHSLYNSRFETTHNPEDLLVHNYWDFVPIAPFLYPNRKEGSVTSLAMVGLGAGTIPKLFLSLYGNNAVVDGAELDPQIIEVGRRFFGLRDGTAAFPNFHTYAQDGRVFINHLQRSYDLVAIDCFRWPYVPSHIVTRECFENIRRHLNPQGVLVVKCDRGVMGNQITATLKSVFPQVFQLVGLSIAVNQPVGDGIANLEKNSQTVQNPTLRHIMQEALATRTDERRPFVEWTGEGQILTDDRSPTEFLVHKGVLAKWLGGKLP